MYKSTPDCKLCGVWVGLIPPKPRYFLLLLSHTEVKLSYCTKSTRSRDLSTWSTPKQSTAVTLYRIRKPSNLWTSNMCIRFPLIITANTSKRFRPCDPECSSRLYFWSRSRFRTTWVSIEVSWVLINLARRKRYSCQVVLLKVMFFTIVLLYESSTVDRL